MSFNSINKLRVGYIFKFEILEEDENLKRKDTQRKHTLI